MLCPGRPCAGGRWGWDSRGERTWAGGSPQQARQQEEEDQADLLHEVLACSTQTKYSTWSSNMLWAKLIHTVLACFMQVITCGSSKFMQTYCMQFWQVVCRPTACSSSKLYVDLLHAVLESLCRSTTSNSGKLYADLLQSVLCMQTNYMQL